MGYLGISWTGRLGAGSEGLGRGERGGCGEWTGLVISNTLVVSCVQYVRGVGFRGDGFRVS